MPPGFSPAATFLDRTRRNVLKQFHASAAFSKQAAYDRLGEVYDACRASNWDADGADAIDQETLRVAYQFIEALPPGFPLPDIAPEPDGHIELEWYRHSQQILSVSVSPDGTLYWAALLGTEDPRGSCPFYTDIPATILHWIVRVCAA